MDRLADFIRKAAAVIAVFVVGYLGESGNDGGFIKDVWASLKTASPPVSMVLFILYIDERRERREAQRQCNERTIDFNNTMNKVAVGYDALMTLVKGLGRGR